MKIWKCSGQGDTLYIQARTQALAKARLFEMMGEIPESLLTWEEVDALPDGEEFL